MSLRRRPLRIALAALRERETEMRATLAGAWAPRPWLRLVGRLPVASRVIRAGGERASLAGLADPDLIAHLLHGEAVASTGGEVLYVSPQVLVPLAGPAVLKLGAQLPVAWRLEGGQRERANVLGGITLVF